MIDVEDRRLGGIDAVMSSSKRVRAGRLANPSGREVMALLEISLHVLSRFNGGTNKRIESLKASTGRQTEDIARQLHGAIVLDQVRAI